ncbi:hypothetical protein NL676_031282 [Syzygium grande]|nr:hypothetical protein NL676_031282 [Syzygium grande]
MRRVNLEEVGMCSGSYVPLGSRIRPAGSCENWFGSQLLRRNQTKTARSIRQMGWVPGLDGDPVLFGTGGITPQSKRAHPETGFPFPGPASPTHRVRRASQASESGEGMAR